MKARALGPGSWVLGKEHRVQSGPQDPITKTQDPSSFCIFQFAFCILHFPALARALLVAAFTCASCTPPGISPGQARAIRAKAATRPLIVAFEGLQPFSGAQADLLRREVAGPLDMAQAATSGNWHAHLSFVKAAHEHGQPIYVVGYSAGCEQALELAAACRGLSIPIRIVFFLDAPAL